MQRQFKFHDAVAGAALTVRVQPRARRNAVAGFLSDGTVKVQLTSPPVEGAANDALVGFLAETLGLNRSQVEIVAGHAARQKLVSVTGIHPADVETRLRAAQAGPKKKSSPKQRRGKKTNPSTAR